MRRWARPFPQPGRSPASLIALGLLLSITSACSTGGNGEAGARVSTSTSTTESPSPDRVPILGPLPTGLAETTTTTVIASDRTGCPGAATCRRYAIRAPLELVAGRIEVEYRINPSGATTPNLTADERVAAIRAATKAWEHADPRLRFRYLGLTDEPAGQPGVAGFGTPCRHGTHPACGGIVDGRPTLTFSDSAPWTWKPCGPGGGGSPCRPYEQPCRPLGRDLRCEGIDLQAIATHEWGHVLGLADLYGADGEGLTMYSRSLVSDPDGPLVRREISSLGLGDILGLRALYPTTGRLPAIAVP